MSRSYEKGRTDRQLGTKIGLALVLVVGLAIVGSITRSLFIWFGVSVLALALVIFTAYRYRVGSYLSTVLAAAYLFRLMIIVANSRLGVLTQPPISNGHYARATTVVDAWLHGQLYTTVHPGLMEHLVAYLHAPFNLVFGSWQLATELGTAFYGVLIGYVVYKIAEQVTTYRTAVLAAGLTTFWPSVVYRSVVIQREVLIVIAMLTMLWVALQWTERIRVSEIILLVIAVGGLFVLRKENLAIVAVTIIAALLARYRRAPRYITGVAMVAVPILAYFALNFGEFTGVGTAISPSVIDRYAHARAHGTATYLSNLHYNSWFDILWYLPVKVVYYLFSPLPWQVNSATDLLAGISGWGLFVATFLAVGGFFSNHKYPEKRFVMAAYAISGIAAYAIIEMNFGAAFRRRIEFVPVILIFTTVGFSSLWSRITARQTTEELATDSENTILAESE